MGSFNSKPKPASVQYVSVPQTPVSAAAEDTAEGAKDPTAQVAETVRRRSLPQTILTSFRGVLGQGEWMPQRKSLLGE